MAWIMLAVGVLLSAFFSGSETGFYRVNRVRLVLDSRSGDLTARGLLMLINNPSLFVATTLIGNNLANYVTSLAIVLLAQRLFAPEAYFVELLAPIVLSPVLFVYGELLPKQLFYLAPHRLVRRGGPWFLFCGLLFAPISALLWGLGRLLRYLLGVSPERVRTTLARKELARVFEEGQEAGILSAAQRTLAQSVFTFANRPVIAACTPVARVVSVRREAAAAEALNVARRRRTPVLAVQEGRKFVGYLRVVDLMLNASQTIESVRPLPDIPHTDSHLAALMHLQATGEMMARVVDGKQETVGLVTLRQLTEPLLRGA
jgi:CBS domain containing-hemolysin-like protein